MATRRERVVLELEDNFTTGMARAAAATAVLNRELNSLSGRSVETSRDTDRVQRSIADVGSAATSASKAMGDGSRDIDRYSGRLGLLLRTIAAFGPAAVPIGAAAIPAIAGLTAGLGAAAGAFGVTLLAVQGLGDGMKALDAYQLEPTKANLEKLRIEMDKLGPSGAEFVRFLDGLEPQLHMLQETARRGLFPGVEAGIDAMLTKLPQVRQIVFNLADALGTVAEEAGRGLAGEGFRDFFNYLETDAAPTLRAFAVATGNVAEGIANLIVGVAPLTHDFTGGMVAATQAFENWTASLSQTQGFQDFLAYVQTTGPEVVDLIGQLALTLASIVEAAAPIGQALLPALTAIADVIETIASSDLGTPLFAGLAAMSAMRLASQAWGRIAATTTATIVAGNARAAGSFLQVTTAQQRAVLSARELQAAESARTRTALAGTGKFVALMAGLTLASTDMGDSFAKSNAASMALMGSFLGPWGTAIGAATGAVIDLQQNTTDATGAIDALHEAIRSGDEEQFRQALANVNEQLDRQTANTVFGNDALGERAGHLVNLFAPLTNYDKLMGIVTGSTDDLAAASEAAAPAQQHLASAMRAASNWAGLTKSEIQGLVSAMEEQRTAALQAFDAVTRYGQALADAREQAKKSNAGINANTEAGRENRQALSQLAAAWNNQSDAVRNNVDKFHAARAAFIETATAMGVPERKAIDLAKRLLEIPRQRVIEIDAQDQKALSAIARIKAELASIPRSISTTYYVNRVNAINKGGYDPNPDALHAVGGFTGRGPKYQRAGIVHAGEVVLPQEIVRRDKALLMSRYGDLPGMHALPGFASGGYVSDYARASTAGTPAFAMVDPANAAANALYNLAGAGKRELEARRKLLDKEIERDQKAVDLAKQHRDAVVQDIASMRQAVADRFRSNPFGGDSSMADNLRAAGVSESVIAQILNAQATEQLRGDIADARQLRQLIRQLRREGVSKQARAYLAQNADLSQIAAYANDPESALLFSRLYGTRQRVSGRTGQFAAMDRYGSELRHATAALTAALTARKEDSAALKAMEHHLQQLNHDGPERTGRAAGRAAADAVDHAVASGHKGRA